MANNIYIGNRYVPVFASPVEWDNLREYEALTIVTYQGTSYTSKKTVPVGIALSNTEYWVVTGNFNAQVEQYRQDVETEIQNRITADTNLTNKIDTETQNRMTADTNLTNKIDAESAKIVLKKPKKRSYILIGDSFSVGIIDANTRGKGWIGHFVDMIGERANVYFNETAIPGVSGFASSLPFLTLLHGAEQKFTDKNEITDIIVMGGTNDASVVNDVPSAIEQFCLYINSNYPYAKLSIGVIGTHVQRNQSLIDAYKTCIKYGANYITSSTHLYCDEAYVSDGTHLTQAGYDFYSKYTNEIIQHGETFYNFHFSYNFLGGNGQITVTEKGIYNWVGNPLIDIPNASLNPNGGCTITGLVSPISLREYQVLGTVILWEISENGVDIPRMVMSSTIFVGVGRTTAVVSGGLMYPWTKNSGKLYRYTYSSIGFEPHW